MMWEALTYVNKKYPRENRIMVTKYKKDQTTKTAIKIHLKVLSVPGE